MLLSIVLPFSRFMPSGLIMKMNNAHEEKTALTQKEGIDVIFPSVNGQERHHWYPFMLYYDAGNLLSRQAGTDVDLTIIYNFGGFDLRTGNSRIYREGSVYEGAFFGAYLLKEAGASYTYLFDDSGLPNTEALGEIAKLDYVGLVLEGMGADRTKMQFEWISETTQKDCISGIDFYKISSTLMTKSPVHKYASFQRAYLQYGLPSKGVESDFKPLKLYSRIWLGRVEPSGVSLVLYAMTPDADFLDQMESDIIQKVRIEAGEAHQ
jgi:hypothetical protein